MPHQCTTCGHTFADGSKEMLSGCPGCGGNTFQFHPADTEVPDEPPTETPTQRQGGETTNRVGRAATKVRDFVSGSAKGGSDHATSELPPPDTEDPSPAVDTTPSTTSAPDTTPNPNAPWPDDSSLDPATDDSEIIDADARRAATENHAQSSARGQIASANEVADTASPTANEETEAASDPSASGGAIPESAANEPLPGDGRVVSEPTGEQPDIDELRQQLNEQFESIKIVEPGQYELNLMELYNREEYIIALQENGRYVIQVPENWLGDRPGDDRS
jgi:predicted  nucleic acid-binding Zn-ribbon protein